MAKPGDIVDVVTAVETDEESGKVTNVETAPAIVAGVNKESETYTVVKLSDLPGAYETGEFSGDENAGVGGIRKAKSKPKSEGKPKAKEGGK